MGGSGALRGLSESILLSRCRPRSTQRTLPLRDLSVNYRANTFYTDQRSSSRGLSPHLRGFPSLNRLSARLAPSRACQILLPPTSPTLMTNLIHPRLLLHSLDYSKVSKLYSEIKLSFRLPNTSRGWAALSLGQEPSIEQRRKLLASLISAASSISDSSSFSSNYLLVLASTIKFLGRSPAGSEELARENGIKTLLDLGVVKRLAELPRRTGTGLEDQDDDADEAAERAFKRREADPLRPHEAEALRCLCNVLMLHPSARDVFPNVVLADDKRTAMKGMLRILGCEGAGFLGGRLLFMLASKPSEAIVELVLDEDVVEILHEVCPIRRVLLWNRALADAVSKQYADRYLALSKSDSLAAQLTSGPMPKPEDVVREHLKLAYTLMLQFGRSSSASRRGSRVESSEKKKRRFWPSKHTPSSDTGSVPEGHSSEDTLEPQVERRGSSSSLKAPFSLAKRVVGAVKSNSQTPAAHSPTSSTPRPSSPTGSPAPSRRPSAVPADDTAPPDSLSLTAVQPFLPIFRPYLALAVSSPLNLSGSSPKDPNPTVRSALNALLNFPVELEELDGSKHSWVQYLPPRTDSEGIVLHAGGIGSLGERLLELLQSTCDAYFPVDTLPPKSNIISSEQHRPRTLPASPDDWITTGEGEATKIEELLSPVMLLLRKLSMIGEADEMFRFVLFPPNLYVRFLSCTSMLAHVAISLCLQRSFEAYQPANNSHWTPCSAPRLRLPREYRFRSWRIPLQPR